MTAVNKDELALDCDGFTPDQIKKVLNWNNALLTSLIERVETEVIGEDERLDIQSDFDKIDIPHTETDKHPYLYSVRQASRNLLKAKQRQALSTIKQELIEGSKVYITEAAHNPIPKNIKPLRGE